MNPAPTGPFGALLSYGQANTPAMLPFGTISQAHMPPRPQPTQLGRIQFGQKANQPGPNPFGTSNPAGRTNFGPNAGQAVPNPFGPNLAQPGRLQFGSRAGQPAAAQNGLSNTTAGQPFASHSVSSQPFRKPFDSSEDPFGRQNPVAANLMQPVAPQNSSSHAWADQQQPPATPAPFGGFHRQQSGQSQLASGHGFQTPAIQQRPAFGGGVAAALQTPTPGKNECEDVD